MAWVYLPDLSNYEVFDVRACNGYLQALCSKSVDLGEESWEAAWITQSELAQDAVLRYWNAEYFNPSMPLRSGGVTLEQASTWKPIAPGFDIDTTSRGGWIWVRASVAVTNPNDVATLVLCTGMEFAVEVNGNIQYAGSSSAADVGAEQMNNVAGAGGTSGGGVYLTKDQYGPGIRAYHDSAMVGCLVRVPEGPLRVRTMYRNVAPPPGDVRQLLTGYSLGVLEIQGA